MQQSKAYRTALNLYAVNDMADAYTAFIEKARGYHSAKQLAEIMRDALAQFAVTFDADTYLNSKVKSEYARAVCIASGHYKELCKTKEVLLEGCAMRMDDLKALARKAEQYTLDEATGKRSSYADIVLDRDEVTHKVAVTISHGFTVITCETPTKLAQACGDMQEVVNYLCSKAFSVSETMQRLLAIKQTHTDCLKTNNKYQQAIFKSKRARLTQMLPPQVRAEVSNTRRAWFKVVDEVIERLSTKLTSEK